MVEAPISQGTALASFCHDIEPAACGWEICCNHTRHGEPVARSPADFLLRGSTPTMSSRLYCTYSAACATQMMSLPSSSTCYACCMSELTSVLQLYLTEKTWTNVMWLEIHCGVSHENFNLKPDNRIGGRKIRRYLRCVRWI